MSVRSHSSNAPSSYKSSAHREKLLRIKQREDLKGLLVNKFLSKYGKNRKREFIEREVEKAMQAFPLTEDNLRRLDENIQAGTSVGTSRHPLTVTGSIISGISVKTGDSIKQSPSNVGPRSVTSLSYMSGASKLASEHVESDRQSVASMNSRVSSVMLPPNKDEWAVILDYNQAIYREEERLRQERLHQQKEAMKRELDKQLIQKSSIKNEEKQEEVDYIKVQSQNLQMLNQREDYRNQLYKEKVLQEKLSRDKQLKEQRRLRRLKEKQDKNMDAAIINRLKEEHYAELETLQNKKYEEMMIRKRMLDENEEVKRAQAEKLRQEKEEDIRLQEAYAKMLDKQEQDRVNELKKREDMQQKFMNRMADTVLKEQHLKNREEDLLLLRHYEDKLHHDMEEDERARIREGQTKLEMRNFLEQQIQEKNSNKRREKAQHDQQAVVWKKESDEYFSIESEEKAKRLNLYKQHAEELKEQMGEKKRAQEAKMNVIERAYNKQLLKDILKS